MKDVVLGRGELSISLPRGTCAELWTRCWDGRAKVLRGRSVEGQRGTLLFRPDPPKRRKAGKP